MPTTLNNFEDITDIILKGKTAVFCGAGISYNSGVPLVYDIKSALLSKLALDRVDEQLILDFKLPFELFMETILSHSGEHGIFNLFELGTPNTNHHFIAELCRLGVIKYVLTTNFDTHIETALDQLNIEYQLLYREEDFESISSTIDKTCIFKLHGSVHDRSNIAITIHKVAEKQLIALRRKVIETILNLEDVDSMLFLGYSFSDLFDITPNLQKFLPQNFKIYNVDHQFDYDYLPHSEPISKIKENQIFNDNVEGLNYKCNTNYFVCCLWKKLIANPYSLTERVPIDFQFIIEEWYQAAHKANHFIKSYLPGHLCNMVASNTVALRYFKQGLEEMNSTDQLLNEINVSFLYAVGMTYREIKQGNKDLQNSLRYLYKGLHIARIKKYRKSNMVLHQSIGIVLADKKNYDGAIFHYEEAERISRLLSDLEIQGKCLGNIGIALKNIAINSSERNLATLNFALSFQKRSLTIAEQLGDKRSEGRMWGNLGIAYSELSKREEMLRCYELAYKISEELNDVLHQGIWAYNIGFDYINVDNEKALVYMMAARAIFLAKGWIDHVRECDDSISKLTGI